MSSPIAVERFPSPSMVALTTRKPALPSIEKRKKPTRSVEHVDHAQVAVAEQLATSARK
jgi:hypothetical protein